MSTTLSPDVIEIIASTRPLLVEHGAAITKRFYERVFLRYPEVKSMFSSPGEAQESKLAVAILAYVDNIERLDALLPAVERIAAAHVKAGVQADHYPIVGAELLGAMADVLGVLDIEVVDAWAAAYGVLADVFIEVEAGLVEAA
ncbi:MAG: globin domain-containing protein [Actinomycetota bacterium]